jgi:hypothetical protein
MPPGHVVAREAPASMHLVGEVLRKFVPQKRKHLCAKGFFFRCEVQIHDCSFVMFNGCAEKTSRFMPRD